MRCPKCDQEMDHIEDEPDVNVPGGWACYDCDVFIHDSEVDYSDDRAFELPDRC